MTTMDTDKAGRIIIFSGPLGAGKDTLENRFREEYPGTPRIVRHITRTPSPGETHGLDYYFIDDTEFDAMVQQKEFVEHAAYIGCQSGTSISEVRTKLKSVQMASMTANFEDGLKLHERLVALGFVSICLFISPCSYETMLYSPEKYTAELRERMETRARPTDIIDGRIKKALYYRDLYLAHEAEARYVDNGKGALDQASKAIARLAVAATLDQG